MAIDDKLIESLLSSVTGRVGRRTKIVRLPGPLGEDSEGQTQLVRLREAEEQDAKIEATKFLLEKKKYPESMLVASSEGKEILAAEVQVQVLFRAMRHVHTVGKYIAVDPTDVRMNLDAPEREYLFREYLMHLLETSPFKRVELRDLEEVMSEMGKGHSPEEEVALTLNSLREFDNATLRFITILLWRERLAQRKRNSSDISSENE